MAKPSGLGEEVLGLGELEELDWAWEGWMETIHRQRLTEEIKQARAERKERYIGILHIEGIERISLPG